MVSSCTTQGWVRPFHEKISNEIGQNHYGETNEFYNEQGLVAMDIVNSLIANEVHS